MMTNATGERNLALIQEVLEVFPETARKERRKHMMVSDPQMESVGKCIISNRKSQPGVMTVRGCAYAGSKGVVFGPIKDMAHISHGRSAAASIPAPDDATTTPGSAASIASAR
jgi:nitrogenase molybdenum-iron protein alpha chain